MKFLSLMLLCSIASANLYAGQLYKWVDEDGNIQYSQTPPPEQATRENVTQQAIPQTDTNTIETGSAERATEDNAEASTADEANADPNSDDPAARVKAERDKNCQRAKDQYARLGTDEKLAVQGPDGQIIELGAEARETRRAEARAFIDNYCQEQAE